ncbi:MAG: hypothetical protein ACJ752_14095 [Gaiellaceae bacterium]
MPPKRKANTIDDRTARIKCSRLAARFIPAWDGVHGSPVITELDAAHAAVSKELARLRAKHFSYEVVLTELIEFVRRYRMPILDGMRDRNGCPDTFGESVVDEVMR